MKDKKNFLAFWGGNPYNSFQKSGAEKDGRPRGRVPEINRGAAASDRALFPWPGRTLPETGKEGKP